ncbi:amidohydrolase [Priestia koreensis]|uniref:amidohydrolase n=1 Tax=Priestia koreensis TaxID=284581 RepID=UPI0028F71B5D|nr:amidohydrolase [Priestia koreensis]
MLAIQHATILTGLGETIHNATILVKEGKIEGFGPNLSVPSDYTVIDGTGTFVTPGLIDVHTHVGISEHGVGREGQDGNEVSSPTTPYVRAIDGINPNDRAFTFARESGITTVQIMPGSANVVGGEMSVVKTHGRVIDDMILRSPSGMKAALGENPKRVYGGKGVLPTTRMGVASLLREQFIKAQNYLHRIDGESEVDRDLGLEQFAKVLKGEIPLRVHAHRADDIMTLIRIAKEFDFDFTIEHCTDSNEIADYIAKTGMRVSVGPTMSSGTKVETSNRSWSTLLALKQAGVPFSITTDHPVVGIQYLMTSVILAVKNGLDQETALQAVTSNAAKHLGVEDRVGSIEVDKDADLVIWSGDPFDLRENVLTTIIGGNVVYQRS